MPRSMLRRLPIAACVVALATPLALGGCGSDSDKQGIDEPAREGLAIELGGVDYTVFITRELNPKITPDNAYVTDEAPPGEALYGIFLRACNVSKDQRTAASDFVVHDNQNNAFQPESLPSDNQFAYIPRALDPKECIPEAGSVAQLGPTAGSMLLFKFPLENTENRPLELTIEQDGQKRTFTLDI
jgi:hypothetical protein